MKIIIWVKKCKRQFGKQLKKSGVKKWCQKDKL